MKDTLRLVVVGLLVLGAAFFFVRLEKRKGYALKVGDVAPDFRLPVLDGGGETALRALRGQVVLVNLWASWCPPCLSEMPSLERLNERMKAEGLLILAVSADEDEEAVRKLRNEHALSFTILRDPKGDVGNAYHATGYPETYLIDRRGVLRQSYIGPVDFEAADVVARIRALLDERT